LSASFTTGQCSNHPDSRRARHAAGRRFHQPRLRARVRGGQKVAAVDRAFELLERPGGWLFTQQPAVGVEQPCLETCAGTRVDEGLCRHDLKVRGCARARRRGTRNCSGLCRRCPGAALGADGIRGFRRHDVDASVGDRGRADDGLRRRFGAQPVFVEHLDPLDGRPQNEELAVLRSDIQLAVAEHERGFLDRAEVSRPQLLAGIQIETRNHAAVVHLVDPVARDDGR
jgi:hypothetical protein